MIEATGLATALAKAQGEIKNPPKKKWNGHYKTHFADLTDGLETIRPTLSKFGIAFTQTTHIEGDNLVLKTMLFHECGESVESFYPVCKVGAQAAMAAAMTWAKRQALFAIVGVHGDDDATDADGSVAEDRARKEAEAYTAASLAKMAEFDSVDFLQAWWKAEGKNRELHFADGANADLYQKLKDSAAKRGRELTPTQESAA